MKGIVLAGGTGSRLQPMTLVTNKHLLPVYDKPMCYHVLGYVYEAGITDVMLVVGKESCGDFMKLLGSGKELGVDLTFKIQEEADGIAGALRLCRDFAANDPVVVVLGDNLLENGLKPLVAEYDGGAMIFVKDVPDPHRFGVATLNDQGKVTDIIEKPKHPTTNLAVVGVYIYDNQVFKIIDTLSPSGRGEFEITDVNRAYLKMEQLRCGKVLGWWQDMGTPEGLYRATTLIYEKKRNKEHRNGN